MPRNLSNESAGASSNAANNGPEGNVLLAGGVSAGSPHTFTGHNQFTEPVQVNTLNSALDIVVGRYLYTNNDILKEVDNEGIVSEVEYTNYKGCAKLNGGSLAQPQSFTGDNSFSGLLTVTDTKFQIKNNGTNVVFDVNGGDLSSNVIITPSGAPNSGIEVRAVGNEGDPNQNKIILNDNVFLPPSADLTLGDLGSLRETLNAINPLFEAYQIYTYDKVSDIKSDPGTLLFHSRKAVWTSAALQETNVVLPDDYYQCYITPIGQLDASGNMRGASFYSQIWVLKFMFSYIQDASNLTNDTAPIISEHVTQFSHQNSHGSAQDEGRVQIYYKPTVNDGDADFSDGEGISIQTYMRFTTVSRNDDFIKLRFNMRKLF
jgi:hypothetical protein